MLFVSVSSFNISSYIFVLLPFFSGFSVNFLFSFLLNSFFLNLSYSIVCCINYVAVLFFCQGISHYIFLKIDDTSSLGS